MTNSSKSLCNIEVMGRVSSLSSIERDSPRLLASTILNGSHIFSLPESLYASCAVAPTTISSIKVETFSSEVLQDTPFLSSCWCPGGADDIFVLGSSCGDVVAFSIKHRMRTGSSLLMERPPHVKTALSSSNAIRSLHRIQKHETAVLACRDIGATVLDVSHMSCVSSFPNVVPRAIGALSVDSNVVAIANYDGKVLLFDARSRTHSLKIEGKPECIISLPDQICSFAMCEETGAVCAGTVSGRIFVLRCFDSSSVRECAFAVGHNKRSPIRALTVSRNKIVAGDIAGRVTVLDRGDNPCPTVYWTLKDLFIPPKRHGTLPGARKADPGPSVFLSSTKSGSASPNWDNAEVTAVAICGKTAWGAFCVHGTDHSYLAALPL